ncbi:hypothetical protein BME99_07045 [Pseudomonas protegens]|nr:hypothetical protein BME99_07045 [Pseudomonas protegens]
MTDTFGHVQGGEAGGTGYQVGQKHQNRVVGAMQDHLPGLWKLGNEMHAQPVHSLPISESSEVGGAARQRVLGV